MIEAEISNVRCRVPAFNACDIGFDRRLRRAYDRALFLIRQQPLCSDLTEMPRSHTGARLLVIGFRSTTSALRTRSACLPTFAMPLT